MRNILKPLAKSVLIQLRLISVVSATDASIHKKMFGSGALPSGLAKWTILIFSNEEMNDAMKIVKSLEESGETIKNEAKEQKGAFLSMLLGALGPSLLGNLLARKGKIRAGERQIRAGHLTFRARQGF